MMADSNMREDEESLVARAVSGHEPALSELLQAVGPTIRCRIASQIPARFRGVLSEDDVLQQAYVDAYLDIRRFVSRGPGAFRGWLTTLAERNLTDAIRMLDAAKRGGGRVQLAPQNVEDSAAALYELLGATNTTPSRLVARAEAQGILCRAIERLPELYQKVVRLYDLEGRAVADVATELNRSQGAVFMLRARAHDRLRGIMGTASDYLSTSS